MGSSSSLALILFVVRGTLARKMQSSMHFMHAVGVLLLLTRQASAFILPAGTSCSVGVIRSGALWMAAAEGGDQWDSKLRKPGRLDSSSGQGGGQARSAPSPYMPPPRRPLAGTKRLGALELSEELARLGDFPTTVKALRPREDRWQALTHRRQVHTWCPVPHPTATHSLSSVVRPCSLTGPADSRPDGWQGGAATLFLFLAACLIFAAAAATVTPPPLPLHSCPLHSCRLVAASSSLCIPALILHSAGPLPLHRALAHPSGPELARFRGGLVFKAHRLLYHSA